MSQSILFLAHVSEAGHTLPKSSYEILGAALELTKQLGARLTIGLIGEDVSAAAETVASAGADLILAPATSRFMRILAGVAHRLNGCVDTHVTSLEAVDGDVRATRWHYRQRIEAVIRRDARPWMVLLESGCHAAWVTRETTGTPSAARVEQIPVILPKLATRTVV